MVSFIWVFFAKVKVHFLLIISNGKLITVKYLTSQKNDSIFHIIDPIKVSRLSM